MNAYPNMTIEIGGHTDNVGSLKYNTDLSESRAKAVVDYLIDKGISKQGCLTKVMLICNQCKQ
jgi:outer membrane protein OmpA-like peptidoglycan-associated protein